MNITISGKEIRTILVSLVLAFLLIVPGGIMTVKGAEATIAEVESAAPVQNQIHLKYANFDPLQGTPAVPQSLMARPSSLPGTKMPFIIQNNGPITDEWTNELGLNGIEIISYIPDNAYLVRLADDQVNTAKGMKGVRWMGEYHPAYKIGTELADATGTVDISVTLFPDATNSYVVKLMKEVGGLVTGVAHNDKVNSLKLTVDASYIEAIAAMPEVKYISLNPLNTIDNDSTTQFTQTGSTSGGRPIHTYGIMGQGQIAVVGDSGIRVDHQNFLGTIYGTTGDQPKIIDYFIPADANAELGDEAVHSYHGSHCAGTVLGDGPTYGAYTTATYDGHAPMAQIVFMDLGRTDDPSTPNTNEGDYIYTPTDLYNDYWLAGYSYGGRVHSNSWGGGTGMGYSDQSAIMDRFVWDYQDYVICFSAGNEGSAANTLGTQPEAKNVIGVASLTNAGTGISTFSSRGPAMDGRIKPDLAAPGEQITSVNGGGTTTYQNMDGTSMSCPATAGNAVLVRQYYADGWYPTGAKIAANGFNPSAALVKATMINGANPLGTIPNYNEGWGRVHLENSLYFSGDTIRTAVVDNENGILTNDYVEYQYSVVAGTRLKISLVWTDYEGDPSASKMLVNDLNLLVTAPGGTQYRGNVFSGGWSATGGSYDTLNNVECVYISAPTAGVYTVRITGYAIARGPQNFALVVSGALTAGYGNVFMDRTVYGDEDTITLDVEDTNNAAGSVNVVLTTTSGDSETVSVPGTAVNSGVFKGGSIVTALGIIATGNGVLEVFHGDTITATYTDASPAHSSRAYAVVDMKGPVISNVYAGGILPTAALIYWNTSENADSVVYYGTNPAALNFITTEDALAINHRVVLKGLSSNTIYYYDVKSTDSRGRSTMDNNGGEHYMFSTTSASTGGNLVLLVDDDDGTVSPLAGVGYEVDWKNNLNQYGWTFTHWDFKVYGTPSLADMNSHTMVVWFVTEGYPQISANDRPVLGAFLDQAVNPEQGTAPMMYLVGQDIGWDMCDTTGTDRDVAWFQNYLACQFMQDDADGGAGVEADPFQVENTKAWAGNIYNLADVDLEVDCFDYPVANDRFWPDDLLALTGAIPTFGYTANAGGGDCAGAAQTDGGAGGTARIVYHGFSHDMIASTNVGTADYNPEVPQIDSERSKMLDQVIQWLLGGNHPTVDLTYPTGGQSLSGTVTITWSVTGASSIDVYYSANGGQAWSPIATGLAGTATSTTWNVGSLLTGNQYKVKVVAKSNAAYASLTDYSESGLLTVTGLDNLGPKCLAGTVSADKQPTVKGSTMWFNATVSDDGRGRSNIAAAEYFIDITGSNGAGTAMTATDGSFNSITEAVRATYSGSSGLSTGRHTLFVHARDSANNWGPFTSTTFDIIATTPMASAKGPIGGPTNDVTITITYSYANNPSSIRLFYTMNGGSTWNYIGTDSTVDGTYDYTIVSGSGTYGWIAVAVGTGSDETDPTPGIAPEAGYYELDLIPPAAPVLEDPVDNYGEGLTPDSVTLTTAGTTQAGGPHNVWFAVVDSNAGSELTTPNSVAEFTDAQYTQASLSDNTRAGPSTTPGVGDEIFVKCQFATAVSPALTTSIELTFEGYFSGDLTATMYAYNAVTTIWDVVGTTMYMTTGVDNVMTRTITDGAGDYISGGNVLWGVYGGTARRSATVDYLEVTIDYETPYTTVEDNTLNWTHDGTDVDHYNIYRANAEGGSYSVIASVPLGTNTYQDEGKGYSDGITWWYIVRAVDPLGNEDTNVNEVPEVGAGPPSPAYEIPLTGIVANRWVFVSFPSGITGNIQDILTDGGLDGDSSTTWSIAKWYNPQTPADPWKTYRNTGTANDMPTVTNAMGFWLYITANGGDQALTLNSYVGIPASTVIQLYSGWNLVGYPSLTATTGATLPAAVDILSVYSGSAAYTDYYGTAMDPIAISHGHAYFVHCTVDAQWTVNNP